MIVWLQSIPGPRFLILFPLLVLVAIAAGRLLLRLSLGPSRTLPEPSDLPPEALAVLAGGDKLLLKTVLFRLWHGKNVEVMSGAQGEPLFRQGQGSARPEERAAAALYSFVKEERSSREILADPSLRSYFATCSAVLGRRCQGLGLVKTSRERIRGILVALAVFILVYGVGGGKLALGLARHRPVGFLILMLLAAFPLLLAALRPFSPLTPLGRRYLKRAREHFAWLKEAGDLHGVDPAYGMALFGLSALSGAASFRLFREAFPADTSGGGCSGCSGGGCGGGGCGGGCGGCGGD